MESRIYTPADLRRMLATLNLAAGDGLAGASELPPVFAAALASSAAMIAPAMPRVPFAAQQAQVAGMKRFRESEPPHAQVQDRLALHAMLDGYEIDFGAGSRKKLRQVPAAGLRQGPPLRDTASPTGSVSSNLSTAAVKDEALNFHPGFYPHPGIAANKNKSRPIAQPASAAPAAHARPSSCYSDASRAQPLLGRGLQQGQALAALPASPSSSRIFAVGRSEVAKVPSRSLMAFILRDVALFHARPADANKGLDLG